MRKILSSRFERFFSNFTQKNFDRWEKLGYHVTPAHFYQPIPIVSKLPDNLWEGHYSLAGLSISEDSQLAFLDRICSPYKHEYDLLSLNEPGNECAYYVYNGMFGEVDGDVLYSVVRHYKPQRIIEIGSGWSTVLTAYALKKNTEETGHLTQLTAIEPYPSDFLKYYTKDSAIIVEKEVQDVNLGFFSSLSENDILFIDSSHTVKIGGDVCYEILEILPTLNKGVLVHFHDIFIPYHYPKYWVKDLKIFWNESYMLQAFLSFNSAFNILWAGHWMKNEHPEIMSQFFRSQSSHSLWIKRR